MRWAVLAFIIALAGCSNGEGPPIDEETIAEVTLDEARAALDSHLRAAIAGIESKNTPKATDYSPVSCHDDPDVQPDKGRAELIYVLLIEPAKGKDTAAKVREHLESEGWDVAFNEGVPEEQVMFFASKDDYEITVSAGTKFERFVIGGTSPCVPK